MTNEELLRKYWPDSADAVIREINNQHQFNGTGKEFLNHCTACGGNWGGMLLTGVREIYPSVYDAIPDNMGIYAWQAICTVLEMLGITFAD